MTKTWTIVIFTDENCVEVVPSSWILNDKCYWPTLTPDKLKAAVKNHDALDTSWPSYPIRLIRNGTFYDYSTAERKCKRAEYSSDVNSDRSKQNMNQLAKIGGSSVQNFTQRALQMLITNDLASTYSWLGRRAKKTFNKLKLADLIIGSVKKSIPNSTNKECEEAIQKWLRRAKERSNNNNKKRGENNNDSETAREGSDAEN
ncbi:uncharacterized protein [Temnothorax longispinosus]|uniref:uncharacterized protein n=1 Tax=Temnothorax longispinosus TaxID=300112 RepID=UPI003A992EDD